ncbi:MAG: hypothetical protein Q7R73_01925 [bacterium]|nr:hypothetical protein [bacterium]
MKNCDLCGKEFTRVDGSRGEGNYDSLMINDYLLNTEWYRNQKPDWFTIKRPNPFGCRRCIKLLIDSGLSAFVGGVDPQKFLTTQEWWK